MPCFPQKQIVETSTYQPSKGSFLHIGCILTVDKVKKNALMEIQLFDYPMTNPPDVHNPKKHPGATCRRPGIQELMSAKHFELVGRKALDKYKVLLLL